MRRRSRRLVPANRQRGGSAPGPPTARRTPVRQETAATPASVTANSVQWERFVTSRLSGRGRTPRQGMPRCDSRCTRFGAWVMNASTRTPKFSLVTHQPGAADRLPRRVPRRSRVRAARYRRRRVDRCSARASPPRRRPGGGCALPQPDAADPRARALRLTAVLAINQNCSTEPSRLSERDALPAVAAAMSVQRRAVVPLGRQTAESPTGSIERQRAAAQLVVRQSSRRAGVTASGVYVGLLLGRNRRL